MTRSIRRRGSETAQVEPFELRELRQESLPLPPPGQRAVARVRREDRAAEAVQFRQPGVGPLERVVVVVGRGGGWRIAGAVHGFIMQKFTYKSMKTAVSREQNACGYARRHIDGD